MKRFWDKVRKTDSCWYWEGTRRGSYGCFALGGKSPPAHRVSYELATGKSAEGQHICHTCDNRLCVRPEHLYAGTHQDNMRDRTERNRQAKGETQGSARLTAEDVLAIRRMYKENKTRQVDLAALFGVSQIQISRIVRRAKWKHI